MNEILIYIGLAALCALILYLIVKSIIESIKREQFRRRNRETQFSGSAVKEEKGFWTSLFAPKYSSRAEAIGDYGSHLEATGATEGHIGQVEGPGSSGNAGTGSHLAGAGFMRVIVRWCADAAARPRA